MQSWHQNLCADVSPSGKLFYRYSSVCILEQGDAGPQGPPGVPGLGAAPGEAGEKGRKGEKGQEGLLVSTAARMRLGAGR